MRHLENNFSSGTFLNAQTHTHTHAQTHTHRHTQTHTHTHTHTHTDRQREKVWRANKWGKEQGCLNKSLKFDVFLQL